MHPFKCDLNRSSKTLCGLTVYTRKRSTYTPQISLVEGSLTLHSAKVQWNEEFRQIYFGSLFHFYETS